ncbi:mannose-6-phosphate receptor binding domain-containing protein [Chaetomidium leptoderma]|uniref:Mannose-6-phosphate receptor binding domain-containing protein n=1 Tax=Chaetomidium leptoderma TaxID=669021 RepID=A0AAN6VLL8_9PEZI|nr:mannose-6-phosphate receptor binding domain-containing protein [Chaetomidium leptoderma]
MHPQHPSRGFLLAIAALAGVSAADEATKTASASTSTAVVTPCVATATSGAFFDLRPDAAVAVAEGEKAPKGIPTEDYIARGWDYQTNFTLNICNAVVNKVDDVVGVEKPLWRNVSAYYETKGKVYSLGQQSGELVPRGRKLVLQYTGGSPCGSSEKHKDKRAGVHAGARYKHQDYDDDEDDEDVPRRSSKDDDDDEDDDDKKDKDKEKGKDKDKGKDKGKDKDEDDEDKEKEKEKEKDKDKDKNKLIRRKSATISFLCDHDPDTATAFSFVGTGPDECAYFFEVRSRHACAGAEPHKPGSVGPGSVFAIIFFIAVLVYVFGGVFYQRTVAHARGWRQLPNYSLWAGIWSFVKDLLVILTSSCARLIPSRRGYHTLSGSPNGRHRNRDDENRLIDQLDEEWDD